MAEKTFKDLYDFIQTAEVDWFGYHPLTDEFGFHIYSMKDQVNICKIDKKCSDNNWISRMNILYSEDDNDANKKIVKVFIADSKHHIDYGDPIIEVEMSHKILNTPIPINLKNVIIEALK